MLSGCPERPVILSSGAVGGPWDCHWLEHWGRRLGRVGKGAVTLFNAVLRERGPQRLVYSTSAVARIVLLATILVIVLGVASVPEGPFLSRFNALSLALIAVCLFGVLYDERWVFDKTSNLFEKDVGIVFLHLRKTAPLDTLQKIVLYEAGWGTDDGPKLAGLTSRRIAILSVVDRNSRIFKLETARGGSVRELRRSAERLSAFCAIPLESGADSPPRYPAD
jgi:hypothetical protein